MTPVAPGSFSVHQQLRPQDALKHLELALGDSEVVPVHNHGHSSVAVSKENTGFPS